jgi:hypothetical protein
MGSSLSRIFFLWTRSRASSLRVIVWYRSACLHTFSSLNKSSLDASNLTSNPAEKWSTFHCCVPAVINFLERTIKDDVEEMLLHFEVDSLAAGNGPYVLAVIIFLERTINEDIEN